MCIDEFPVLLSLAGANYIAFPSLCHCVCLGAETVHLIISLFDGHVRLFCAYNSQALPLDYLTYTQYQCQQMEGPQGDLLWQFWQTQLSGNLPVLMLPTDRSRDYALICFEFLIFMRKNALPPLVMSSNHLRGAVHLFFRICGMLRIVLSRDVTSMTTGRVLQCCPTPLHVAHSA